MATQSDGGYCGLSQVKAAEEELDVSNWCDHVDVVKRSGRQPRHLEVRG